MPFWARGEINRTVKAVVSFEEMQEGSILMVK